MKYFVYAIVVIVAAAVVAGFFIVGSPKEARLRSFDQKRIQDLQFLQSEILYYWQNKGNLPGSLSDLRDDIRGTTIPADPETDAAYDYLVKGPLSFALCSEFSLADRAGSAQLAPRYAPKVVFPETGVGVSENWGYEAGIQCFERTIDENFYRRQNQPVD